MNVKVYNQADMKKWTTGADGANIAASLSSGPPTTGIYQWCNSENLYSAIDAGGSLITSAGGFASWKDLSNNSRHANQSSSGSQMTYTANQQNGLPAAVAGATQRYYTKTGLNSNFPFVMIGCFKLVAHSGSMVIFSLTATNANNYMFECTGSSPRVQMRHSSYSGFYSDNMTTGSYHLVYCSFNGASSILKIDNNANVTGTVASGESLGSIQLGYDGSYSANRDAVEWLLYQANATDPATGDGLLARRYIDVRCGLGLGI